MPVHAATTSRNDTIIATNAVLRLVDVAGRLAVLTVLLLLSSERDQSHRCVRSQTQSLNVGISIQTDSGVCRRIQKDVFDYLIAPLVMPPTT